MNPRVSFIILTWNSQSFISACLDSINRHCRQDNLPCELVVVDNGSTDATNDIIRGFARRQDNVIHLPLEKNFGTTYSRNLGMKKSAGKIICIMDSDTEIRTGSLASAIRALEDYPDVGIVAPRLVLPNGTVQNSVKRFPTFWNKLMKLPKLLLKIKVSDGDFYADFPFESATPVDTAISACWLFNKSLVTKVGYLDEKIFYSPEDLDYSVRVWLSGFKILYYPDLVVLHNTQWISHRRPFSRVSLRHFLGLLYYYRKHGGWLSRARLYRKIESMQLSPTPASYRARKIAEQRNIITGASER